MLVIERMTTQPATITAETPVHKALEVIQAKAVRHLPVVNDKDQLIGIVSEKDLLRADSGANVEQIMTRDVVTATEYTALEDAARIMADRAISSLPVMRNGKLVGIITETNLFMIFLELLGAREEGVRLTMLVPEEKGVLASVTNEIASMGGNILALSTFRGEDPTNRMVTVKVSDVPTEKLVAIMEALGMEIVDVRG
ncbi:MAG TPA: CBS domain-containing protein, partial [Alphaproteobacteria bacterium]|nr:CBS domain-containing protein [Alphaproteobacteria bacterium]